MFNQSAIALLLSIALTQAGLLFGTPKEKATLIHHADPVRILICSYSHSAASSRKSNANGNIFNLLLGLYKINPLKGSPVFQSFSNNLLLGMGRNKKDSPVLNFESGESVKVNEQVKMNLNEIEKIIHTKTIKPAKHYEKPAYDVDDVGTENFKADIVIDDKLMSKEELQRSLDNHIMEDFTSLFEHIGSKENDIEMPVTKLLPVNDTIIRYLKVSNLNETVFGLKDANIKSVNHIGTAIVHDRNRKEVLMDNLVEGLGDVIVL